MFRQPARIAWSIANPRTLRTAAHVWALPCIRLKHTAIDADDDGLPRTATWSIKSLLPPSSPPPVLTPSDLTHLLRLARLRPPATAHETTALVKDVNDLAHFTRHIQSVNVESVAPLRGVWGDGIGMTMREDVVEEGEASGRKLLGKARRVNGNYYTVGEGVTE